MLVTNSLNHLRNSDGLALTSVGEMNGCYRSLMREGKGWI